VFGSVGWWEQLSMEEVLLLVGFSTCENVRFRLSMLLVPQYELLRKVFANRNCFSSSENICLYLQSPSKVWNRRWDDEDRAEISLCHSGVDGWTWIMKMSSCPHIY
jgi:hypothetical protein